MATATYPCFTRVAQCALATLFAGMPFLRADESAPSDPRPRSHREEEAKGILWGYPVLFLVNDKAVQQCLGLNEHQSCTMTRFASDYLAALRRSVEIAQQKDGLSREGEEFVHVVARVGSELKAEYGKLAVQNLTPEQRTRLAQIAFRLCSLDILGYEEVTEELDLDDAQRVEVSQIIRWQIAKSRELLIKQGMASGDAKNLEGPLDQVLAEAERRFAACLNQEQSAWLERMQGPPIGFRRPDINLTIRENRSGIPNGSR